MTEEDRLQFATQLLRGKPLDWWRSYEFMIEHGDISPVENWDEFKETIRAKYKPFDSAEIARDKLAALRQTTSVEDYIGRFEEITMEIPAITDDEKRDRFVRGLKLIIRKEIRIRETMNFVDTTRLAAKFDNIISRQFLEGREGKLPWQNYRYSPRPSAPMELDAIRTKEPLTEAERDALRQKGCCFYCRETGHIARYCPRKGKAQEGPLKEYTQ